MTGEGILRRPPGTRGRATGPEIRARGSEILTAEFLTSSGSLSRRVGSTGMPAGFEAETGTILQPPSGRHRESAMHLGADPVETGGKL